MARFIPVAALALTLLAVGTAAEAQSYAPLGSIPTRAVHVTQVSPMSLAAPTRYTAASGARANGTAVAPGHTPTHR